MPHTRSAKKRLRQNEKRRMKNRSTTRAVKTYIKRFYTAVENASTEDAQKEHNLAVKKLDQAAAKGMLHKNMASRKKAQLDKAMHEKTTAKSADAS